LANEIINESIKVKFDRLFHEWNYNKQKDRHGLHASGILKPDDFCYREHVLNHFYYPTASLTWTKLLRVFLEGWYVHQKWQDLFKMAGIYLSVEKQHRSKFWEFSFTPDAIIEVMNRKIVVEIKSHSSNGFDQLNSPPANAYKQAQLYMHSTGIPYGLVLVENKNNQDYKTWFFDYDPNSVTIYIERLLIIKKLINYFKETGKLPKRCDRCDFEGKNNPRAKFCEMREVCFGNEELKRNSKRN
jgi:hypothetical protein